MKFDRVYSKKILWNVAIGEIFDDGYEYGQSAWEFNIKKVKARQKELFFEMIDFLCEKNFFRE